MAASVPPGVPKQSSPPNFQQNPETLSDNLHNLNLNRPPSVTNSAQRAPPFAQSQQFHSSTLSPPMSRPRPPPPGAFSRPAVPLSGPPHPTFPPNLAGRPVGSPVSQPPPRPRPGAFPPGTLSTPAAPPPGARPNPFSSSSITSSSNVPPLSASGGLLSGGTPAWPGSGPPPTAGSGRAPSQAPNMHSLMGSSEVTAPHGRSVQHISPFSAATPNVPPFPATTPNVPPFPATTPNVPPFPATTQGLPPSSAISQGLLPPQSSPSVSQGLPPWQVGPTPQVSGFQQPRRYGMPPPPTNQGVTAMSPDMGLTGPAMVGSSQVDPSLVPRPVCNSSVIIHETRQGNQANPPPPATSNYIVKDTGNCSPRYMRCTINQIPCTADIVTASELQFALLVQPLALPHSSEEPIQIVDFGESGPVRCSHCKGYINPFAKFFDQGRQFICNLCGSTNATPREYHCNLGPDGRRRDADERPELCRGTVEFVAPKEYMLRDPMPAVYFFLIDVSMSAMQTGAAAAACGAIMQVISDIPEGPLTMVGIATFDSTIHFYNLRPAFQQPLMLVVPDIQDVYTPLQTDVVVQLSECRQQLELLLESIPTMFRDNKTAESAFGAAIKSSFLAIKSTGGKLLVFQSVLPSTGIGALTARETEGRSNISSGEKEAHKLLQPADSTLKTMAIEFAEYQVCVDIFLTTQTFVDIASISVIPRITGGQLYYYHPFSALSDPAKLYNDVRWNVSRPQGFEAVMRVRCSKGIDVKEYNGNFCTRMPTDVDLPGIDCDKTIMVTLKHDEKLQDGADCSFQCALLYTTVSGQRRIRVSNLSLPCTIDITNLFRAADMDAQFVCMMKQVTIGIPSTPLLQLQEKVTNLCIKVLLSYRKFCTSVSSTGQLILPEALKLLPLYTLALAKSTGLRTDGRIEDRSFWFNCVNFVSTPLAISLIHPRMVAIHELDVKENGPIIPYPVPLSSEYVSDAGVYLLENGEDGLLYVGSSVDSNILEKLFGISSVNEISTQFVLKQFDNPLSRKLNAVLNEIRRERSSYLRLKFCKKGDPSEIVFFSHLIEDKNPTGGLSYVEFLVYLHRQIQTKMA